MKLASSICVAAGIAAATPMYAQVFTEDFESGNLDQFTFVNSGTNSNGMQILSGSGTNTSNVLEVTSDAQSVSDFIGAFAQVDGLSIDADTTSFEVTFDLAIVNGAGGFDDVVFVVGDLSGGITSGGSHFYTYGMNNNSNSNEVVSYNEAGDPNNKEIIDNFGGSGLTDDVWYSATFTWDAGTDSATYSVTSLDGLTSVASSTVSVALTGDVQIGFGSYNDYGAFDNIVVTAIPEPGTYALMAGIAGMAFVMLRRRKA